jgi:molybdate-binding protein
VAAALSLADVLECSVEELFGVGSAPADSPSQWAWPPSPPGGAGGTNFTLRYWCGKVAGRTMFYPVEATPLGELPHDGMATLASPPLPLKGRGPGSEKSSEDRLAEKTLVMAGCDPAAGLLARLYEQTTGFRMLVFTRSSRQALELLQQGLVHVAGVHLASADQHDGNAAAVRQIVSQPATLLRVTEWEDGIAVGPGIRTASTVRGLLRNRLTWIGREPGSGARQCLDELLDDRPSPRRIARDHRGVAEAVRCGWADAGVCLRLVAEEAGLRFLPIRNEGYDLCYTSAVAGDPRVQSLVRVVQSHEFRQLVSELPGYDSRSAGDLSEID